MIRSRVNPVTKKFEILPDGSMALPEISVAPDKPVTGPAQGTIPNLRGGYLGDNYRSTAPQTYQGLRAGGLNHIQAVGFMGNFQEESGLNPNAFNKKEGAIGQGQWRFDRADNLKRFAADAGVPWTDPYIQGKFAAHEIQTVPTYASAWKRLQGAQNATDAAGAVVGWERPAGYNLKTGDPTGVPSYRDRVGHANAFGRIFGGQTDAPGPTVQAAQRGFLAGASAPGPTQMAAANLAAQAPAAPTPDMPAPAPMPAAPAPTPEPDFAAKGGLFNALQNGGDMSGIFGGGAGGAFATAMKGLAGLAGQGQQQQEQSRPIVVNPDNVNTPQLGFMNMIARRKMMGME